MDPCKNPNKEEERENDSIFSENDDESYFLDDEILMEDERKLDDLLLLETDGLDTTSRHYDEKDYQSHRRESFPHTHQPLRQHSQKRRTSTNKSDANTSNNFELEAIITPHIAIPLTPLSPYHGLSESEGTPKKVQFEIGGSNTSMGNTDEQTQSDRKKHRKHHHHRSKDSSRQRQAQPQQESQIVPDNLSFGSMDDLDHANLSTHRFGDNKGYRRHKFFSRNQEDSEGGRYMRAIKYDHQPHEIFVELDVLSGHGEHREWKEAARWIKYEEDVLEGSDRWGRPHVASLSFHSLINLRRLIESGVTMLDMEERDLPGVAYRAVEAMVVGELIRSEDKANVMRALLLKHKHVEENEPLWKFNLRRNTTTSGSLTSLHAAVVEQDKHNRNHARALGSPNTVPEGLGASDGFHLPRMQRRNSATSRLINEHHGHHHHHHNNHHIHHSGIEIEEPVLTSGEAAKLSLSNLSQEDAKWVLNKESLLRRIPTGAEASIVLVGKDEKLKKPIMAFIRLAESSYMPNITEVPIPVRFLYILLGPSSVDLDYKEIGRSISTLMSNRHFHEIAYRANDRRDMLKGIHEFLDESIVLPPGDWDSELFPFEEMKEKRQLLKKRKEKRRQSSIRVRRGEVNIPGSDGKRTPPGGDESNLFKRTKKAFGGMRNDIKRRLPFYFSDIKDGLNFQTVASVIYIYFACISGAIAFGGILGEKTEKHIGISETMVGTFVAGVIFSMFSAQPLIILGTTGPLLLFDGALYIICKPNGMDYLAFRFCIGTWLIIIGIVFVAFDGSVIAGYFTLFVQDIFSGLISLLFIYEVVVSLFKVYAQHPIRQVYESPTNGTHSGETVAYPNTALLSTVLCLGTFVIAYALRGLRTSRYFTLSIRKLLGNFAVLIAIAIMVGLDYGLNEMAHTDKLNVPQGLDNSKPRSSWLVDMSHISVGMAFLAFIPALLVFILMFMETSICALIINKKEHKLKKGTGYHLDIFLVCLINGILGCIGGAWVCAATVRAVSHTSSLIMYSTNNPPGEKPQIVGVKEQRVSNFIISILVGVSVLMSPVLVLIPMPVLFGIFLFMGISSMDGVQLFQRCTLLFKQVSNHPQVPYVQRVKTSKMHLFTLIQILCLGILFGVKLTPAALAIPFLLMLLVPLRLVVLKRIFKPSELAALDGTGADELLEDDQCPSQRPSLEELNEENKVENREEAEDDEEEMEKNALMHDYEEKIEDNEQNNHHAQNNHAHI